MHPLDELLVFPGLHKPVVVKQVVTYLRSASRSYRHLVGLTQGLNPNPSVRGTVPSEGDGIHIDKFGSTMFCYQQSGADLISWLSGGWIA